MDELQQFLENFIKKIFDSKNFTQIDFDELYKIGWNDKDIYDSIEHAGLMLKNGRILTVYIKKIK